MDREHHKIKGKLEGDIVIYRCDQCDYWATQNLKTHEFKVHNMKRYIRHSGFTAPKGVELSLGEVTVSQEKPN